MKKLPVIALSVVLLLLAVHGMVVADSQDSPVVAFPVVGNPRYVAVETPSRVWYTVPDQDIIGRLAVTSTVDYDVVTYTTTITEPYDLTFASGYLWFTGRGGQAVGRLDPSNGSIATFSMVNAASQPAGIDVLPGSPVQVWVADEGAGALVQLVVTSTVDYHVTEYPLPVDRFGSDSQVRGLYVQSADRIWFAAPGSSSIGRFIPSQYSWKDNKGFTQVSTGTGSTPLAIDVDAEGYPWFVDAAGNRIGKFFPQTLADFVWYPVPSANAGLYDIVTGSGYVWFTESDTARVGRVDSVRRRLHEFTLSGSHPGGLDIDLQGQVWIADMSGGRIFSWRSPYFHQVLLPIVLRGAQ